MLIKVTTTEAETRPALTGDLASLLKGRRSVRIKVSAASNTTRDFIIWQVVGNLAGFITVLTLTGLLRDIPLHIAFTVTTGLAVLGVQVVAAGWLFHEPITTVQWFGALLVIVGIGFLSWR